MALAFILLGIVLVIVAIRNSYQQLGSQLKADFTGQGNFWYWVASLAIIAAIGYIPGVRTPSRMLLGLVLVVFFLKNGTGFFANLQSALSNPPAPSQTTVEQVPTSLPVQLQVTGGGASGAIGAATGAVSGIAKLGSLFGL